MRKSIILFFSLLCLNSYSTSAQDKSNELSFYIDTVYTIQMGVYKTLDDINPRLKEKYTELLGFKFNNDSWKMVPDAKIYRDYGNSYMFSVNQAYVVGEDTSYFQTFRLYHGAFKSQEDADAYILNFKDFTKYFGDYKIAKAYLKQGGEKGSDRFKFDIVDKPSVDAWAKSTVDVIGDVLFFDPFKTIGRYDNRVMINGEPMIKKDGDEIKVDIPIIVVWLIFGALFFTIFMKFINIRGFRHAIGLVSGKHDDPTQSGEVSHFQALATALSGTVGLGNIAGVAVAISVGGPGATFWMIIAGLLGMSSKFVECTLGVKYRKVKENGEVSGGPMYYLSQGLEKRGLKKLGMVLAAMFAVLCVLGSFGGGNMFQANQAYAQVAERFTAVEGYGAVFGIVMALLVGIVIIGGIKSIAKVTEKIVPVMAVLYVTVALIIIFKNIDEIGHAFSMIFDGAFSADAAKGGIIGVLILGFKRAAFSNEAGVGSASIAHSAVKTDKPVTEGFVSLLEPFIDTVIICTMTALVIIITGYSDNPYGMGGAPLTSLAFESVYSWFPWLLMVAIILFAFSTMISWSYYGLKAWTYLMGDGKAAELSYKLIFLVFVVIGSSIELRSVINFSDMMILAMAFPNIIGMLIMVPEVRRDVADYLKNLRAK